MDDSFRVRVDKVFGSLGAPPSIGVTPSLWSLTDEEIERREWNRKKGEAEEHADGESRSSGVGSRLEQDLEDLSDDGEEEGEEIDGEKKKGLWNNSGDDFSNVKSNIGRDCTLDFEEEEDAYDKVAAGTEQDADRVYMKDVKFATYGIDDNEYGELPTTLENVVRDPRANHEAAKIRLKEDAEAAGDFDTLQLSDISMATNVETEDLKKGELETDIPKPILKKRENMMDSRSQKRVRFAFDPDSSTQHHEEQQPSGATDLAMVSHTRDDNAMPEQASDLSHYSSAVPDYLINPSKYTRYTFDSSDDMDDQSNRKAYMDLFENLRKTNTESLSDGGSVEIPKSVVFTPKKKKEDEPMLKGSEGELNTGGSNVKNKSLSISIAAEEDVQESETFAMEEDEKSPEQSLKKPGRKYRARPSVEDN